MKGTKRISAATKPRSSGLGMPISHSAAAMNRPKAVFMPVCARKKRDSR